MDWQLAHLKKFDYLRSRRESSADTRGWIQGTFWVGLSAWAQVSDNPKYFKALAKRGKKNNWELGRRIFQANDFVIGQIYLDVYARKPDPEILTFVRERLDYILANRPKVSLEYFDGRKFQICRARWCWSDALFMAPQTWFGLSRATDDPRYADYADEEFWATTNYLLDPEENLYFRDSRFFTRRDDAGQKIFWSRGNGWAFAGLANILKVIPDDYKNRPKYEALFKEMAARLAELQQENGFWPTSLLVGKKYITPETSGTAFFVYGFAWGINEGLLAKTRFAAARDRGWQALLGSLHPDVKLGWVQNVGDAPDEVSFDDTQLYGVGAFLLAASEMHKGGF